MSEEMLNLRKRMKKKKPKFRRQEIHRKKALKDAWRKPRGINSKLRVRKMSRGRVPKPGYGSPKEVKGLNMEGFKEILVNNVKDMDKIKNPKEEVAVISKTVGRRKRFEMIEYAMKKNIRIGNHKLI